jgi:hypothetical protein
MSATTEMPVTIAPEAAALAAELGMNAPLEQMVEYARGLPGVYRIDVEYAEPSDEGDVPGVTVYAWSDRPVEEAVPTRTSVADWESPALPPRYVGVCSSRLCQETPCEVENSWSWPGTCCRERSHGTGGGASSTHTTPSCWSAEMRWTAGDCRR